MPVSRWRHGAEGARAEPHRGGGRGEERPGARTPAGTQAHTLPGDGDNAALNTFQMSTCSISAAVPHLHSLFHYV